MERSHNLQRDSSIVYMIMSRLDVIVASARARQPFTHFLSIPLNSPALQEAFLNFQEEVLLLPYFELFK